MMQSVVLQSDLIRLVIRPDLGAGISDLSIKGPANYFHPLMRRASDSETNPSNLASFVMAPWANRLAGAKLAFAGKVHELRATSGDGSAIHGDVRSREFATLDRSPVSARFEFDSRRIAAGKQAVNFPFPFVVRVRYEVEGPSVKIGVEVHNAGDEPMPAGCGIHPYFMRALWSASETPRLRAMTAGEYQLTERLPSGPPVASELSAGLEAGVDLPGKPTDTVLGGFDGKAELVWPKSGVRVQFRCTSNQRHLVVFVPHGPPHPGAPDGAPLPYFAFEPQTNVNDAANLVARGGLDAERAGLVTLPPGGTLSTETVLTVQVGS